MTEVVVTGGTGVLGRQVVSQLLAAGHSVRVLSRQARPTVPNGVQVVQGDLVPGKNLDRAVAGVDAKYGKYVKPVAVQSAHDQARISTALTTEATGSPRRPVHPLRRATATTICITCSADSI